MEDAGNVGYAHAVVGYRNTGGNYAAYAVGKLSAGNHTAAALQCKGIVRELLMRRQLVKAADKGELQLAAAFFLQHCRNLHTTDIFARGMVGA